MSLKLYYDVLSQPSRALLIYMQLAKIPFQNCPVALRKGEHFSDEFKKVNAFGKVPVIDDKGFKMMESVGIVRYLAREYNVPDKWYPKDSKKQARVDEYLEWQHHNTRLFCAMYFRILFVEPLMTGKPAMPARVEKYKQSMENTLDQIENDWLGDKKWIAGDEITVADIFAACEIEQPRIVGYDPKEGRPKLADWIQRVRQSTNPYYDEAHKVLNKVVQSKSGQAKL